MQPVFSLFFLCLFLASSANARLNLRAQTAQWVAVGETHEKWGRDIARSLIQSRKPAQCLFIENDYDDYSDYIEACNRQPEKAIQLNLNNRFPNELWCPGFKSPTSISNASVIIEALKFKWKTYPIDEYADGQCRLGAPGNKNLEEWTNCRNQYMLRKILQKRHQCNAGVFFLGRWHISDRHTQKTDSLTSVLEAAGLKNIFKIGLFDSLELGGPEKDLAYEEWGSFDLILINERKKIKP